MDERLKQLLLLGREHYGKREFDKAEPILREVLEHTDRFADVHDMLGVIAHARGNFIAAERHFERALSHSETAGVPRWAAHVLLDHGSALGARGRRSDRPRAAALLERSEAIFTSLSIPYWAGVARTARARIGRGRGETPPLPAGLSEREAEVLRLLAQGRTNREIAEALCISYNTVIRHVAHIYAKTDTTNRAEAAAFATRHGLT